MALADACVLGAELSAGGIAGLVCATPDGAVAAPHLNVTVFARGLLKQLLTRVYFPDETAANAADPILELVPPGDRELLIAKPEGELLRFDIRLQGEDETPFFAF